MTKMIYAQGNRKGCEKETENTRMRRGVAHCWLLSRLCRLSCYCKDKGMSISDRYDCPVVAQRTAFVRILATERIKQRGICEIFRDITK